MILTKRKKEEKTEKSKKEGKIKLGVIKITEIPTKPFKGKDVLPPFPK